MSRPETQTLLQADQALAILREAGRPMTATEVGERVGYASLIRCRGGDHEEVGTLRWVRVCQGDGTDLQVRTGILGGHMTGCLNVLLHAGRVTRAKVGQRVYWSYVERPEDVQAARVLSQLAEVVDSGS